MGFGDNLTFFSLIFTILFSIILSFLDLNKTELSEKRIKTKEINKIKNFVYFIVLYFYHIIMYCKNSFFI